MHDDARQERRAFERIEAERIAEYRLLKVERDSEAQEQRIRSLETDRSAMTEKLKVVDEIKLETRSIKDGQLRTQATVIIAIITILATFILGHFGPAK